MRLRSSRSGSGCGFDSSTGSAVHPVLPVLFVLFTRTSTLKLIGQAVTTVKKAVVRMHNLLDRAFVAALLAGGSLALTGHYEA